MRPGLLILPFAALLIAAIGVAIGSAYRETSFLQPIGFAASTAMLLLWVVLDYENFRLFFGRKGAKYGLSSGLNVILGVAVIIGLSIITSRPRFNKSIDLSRDKLNSLSDDSVRLVQKIKKEQKQIRILAFFSDEQFRTQFRDLLKLYEGIGGVFQTEFYDPNSDPTRAIALKITDPNTVIVQFAENEKRITSFTEEKLTNALINVLKDRIKKIYFTTGHGEPPVQGEEANGFKLIYTELENNRYTVSDLSLLEQAKVPDDASALIIAGPKYDLKEEEARILEEYLKRGGSVLALIPSMTSTTNVNKVFNKFGVSYNEDLLILAPNDPRTQFLGQNLAIVTEFDDFNPITRDFAARSQVTVGMRFTRSVNAIEDNTYKMKVSLAAKTSDAIVKVKNVKVPKDLEGLTDERWEVGSFPVLAVSNGRTADFSTAKNGVLEKSGAASDFVVASTEHKSAESRLVAFGSVDFATNQGAQEPSNRDLFLNSVNYLLQDDDFISIHPKDPTKSELNLTSNSSQFALFSLTFIYPFVFLFGGLFVWMQRRRA